MYSCKKLKSNGRNSEILQFSKFEPSPMIIIIHNEYHHNKTTILMVYKINFIYKGN
jgi:hypothetical protein